MFLQVQFGVDVSQVPWRLQAREVEGERAKPAEQLIAAVPPG